MSQEIVLTVAGSRPPVRVRGFLVGSDSVAGGVGGWEEVTRGKGKKRRTGLAFTGSPGYNSKRISFSKNES